jgi:hypothetical protein
MNLARLRRTYAIAGAVLLVVLAGVWVVAGFNENILFAIAIAASVAVAIFSDTKSTCAPRLFRRRS